MINLLSRTLLSGVDRASRNSLVLSFKDAGALIVDNFLKRCAWISPALNLD
jgi:hypothetical protein